MHIMHQSLFLQRFNLTFGFSLFTSTLSLRFPNFFTFPRKAISLNVQIYTVSVCSLVARFIAEQRSWRGITSLAWPSIIWYATPLFCLLRGSLISWLELATLPLLGLLNRWYRKQRATTKNPARINGESSALFMGSHFLANLIMFRVFIYKNLI